MRVTNIMQATSSPESTAARVAFIIVLVTLSTQVLMAAPLHPKRVARPPQDPTRIIGFLELPSVFRPHESGVAADAKLPDHPQPIKAYSRRSADSTTIAVIRRPEDIDTREDPFRRPCAVVYAALDNWYWIDLKSGTHKLKGWVYVENSNAFVSLEWLILLADNSCYVTDDWDAVVWKSPRKRLRDRTLKRPTTRDITVIEKKTLGNELWLQVEFSDAVSCDWKELPPVVGKGWIRAYGKSGKLQFWFHPRLDC
jgi:hypothetical protein